MTFPGYGAQIYTNEAGEPIGWDYPSHDDPYDDNPYNDLDDRWDDEEDEDDE